MTDETLPLAELLAKAGDGDFLRNVAETVLHMQMAEGRGGSGNSDSPMSGFLA